jgi:GTP pyrophosphokinase
LNEFLSDLGRGRIILKDVIGKLFPDVRSSKNKIPSQVDFIESARSESEGINLDGVKNLVVNYAKCCNPVPGDSVIGYISRGRGLIVHRLSCFNLSSLSDSKERIVSVNWNIKKDISFKTKLHITCLDKAGVLHNITETIAKEKINILDVETDVNIGSVSNIWIICTIKDLNSLNGLISAISKIKNVDTVERVFS